MNYFIILLISMFSSYTGIVISTYMDNKDTKSSLIKCEQVYKVKCVVKTTINTSNKLDTVLEPL